MDAILTNSIERLAPLGRYLYDRGPETLWERDTRTLPASLRARRRAYKRFGAEQLAPRAIEADRAPHDYDPRPLFAEAARRGFQSELVPPPFGKMPMYALASRRTIFHSVLKAEEFCAACGGLGLSVLAHDLGIAPLMISGHLPTWKRWLLPLSRDNMSGHPKIAAFAITEPSAGSDAEDTEGAAAARFTTTARAVTGGYVLNGQKVFISGGAHADIVSTFAVLEPTDGSKGRIDRDWTAFVVESNRKGFRVGRSEHKLGQRACDATELFFDDVFVPSENLIGTERSGWALNRNVLNYSRLPVAAIGLGIARGAVEAATEFARSARLGGKPLLSYQEVQLALADLWLEVMAMRGMVWQAARHKSAMQGINSATKARCGDGAFAVTTRAMEFLADHGTLTVNRAEKTMRDARLNQIYEGTNEVNRLGFIEAFWESEIAR